MTRTIHVVTDDDAFFEHGSARLRAAGCATQRASVTDVERLENARAVLFDARCNALAGDELLAWVGAMRSLQIVVAVGWSGSIPPRTLVELADLLDDMTLGLCAHDVDSNRRVLDALARRMDARRIEFVTTDPGRAAAFLVVVSGGQCYRVTRPYGHHDDLTDVASITIDDDGQHASVHLKSAKTIGVALSVVSAPARRELVPSTSLDADEAVTTAGGIAAASSVFDVDPTRLGKRIRELRLAAGLTQAELATRTGIHRPNIARVEAGRHTPSLETLTRVAAAIGVAPATLFNNMAPAEA